MKRYLLTAQSSDRPGIVAHVSAIIAERGWSIEDASMTRLVGRFAMLLVISTPDDVELPMIHEFLARRLDDVDAIFTLDAVEEDAPVAGAAWTVTVYGSDRPGIVSAVTASIADKSVNIDNLATRMTPGPAGPVYSMLIDVTVPDGVDGDTFADELKGVGDVLGVTCHAVPVDVDVL